MEKDHYIVKTRSKEERQRLVDHLEKQGFKYAKGSTRASTLESRFPIVIYPAQNTFHHIHTVTSTAAAARHAVGVEEFNSSEYGGDQQES
ncbi:MAG: hypothetical protein IIU36_02320 [Firmicutes bacterium]|nr:hypothetical protein [Bacillota bacterium]